MCLLASLPECNYCRAEQQAHRPFRKKLPRKSAACQKDKKWQTISSNYHKNEISNKFGIIISIICSSCTIAFAIMWNKLVVRGASKPFYPNKTYLWINKITLCYKKERLCARNDWHEYDEKRDKFYYTLRARAINVMSANRVSERKVTCE